MSTTIEPKAFVKNITLSLFGERLSAIAFRSARRIAYLGNRLLISPMHWLVLNPLNRAKHASRETRSLEIGPGHVGIAGFETLNVISGRNVTYVGNAARRLPFPAETFDVIYASHIIEHIPWYQVQYAINEWVKELKPGGMLQIWVPDGLKMAQAFVAAEELHSIEFHNDGWWAFNEERDPCKWAAGRMFSYGDGSGGDHPNWHRALFSARYLKKVFHDAALINVREMDRSEVRAYDHGWINLGVCGTKPKE